MDGSRGHSTVEARIAAAQSLLRRSRRASELAVAALPEGYSKYEAELLSAAAYDEKFAGTHHSREFIEYRIEYARKKGALGAVAIWARVLAYHAGHERREGGKPDGD